MPSDVDTLARARARLRQLTAELAQLRRSLHRAPELSGDERTTAEYLATWGRRLSSARTLRHLGGHGLAWVFGHEGPTTVLRAELDAVPVQERADHTHCSQSPGVAHACGHDGHMAALAGAAVLFDDMGVGQGRVAVLFQPAEETGTGMRAVLEDPRFWELDPQRAFALHNLPGYPVGSVVVRDGAFSSASVGLRVELVGAESHAAEPDLGRNPSLAVAALLERLDSLHRTTVDGMATVTHARVGTPCFGTAAGSAEVRTTLRAERDETLDAMVERVDGWMRELARDYRLACSIERCEPFRATMNDAHSVALARRCAEAIGVHSCDVETPFAWSEDFGELTARVPGALIGVGVGREHPALHSPDYDFPDDILETAALLAYALATSAGSASS